jgi:hypothetical protein
VIFRQISDEEDCIEKIILVIVDPRIGIKLYQARLNVEGLKGILLVSSMDLKPPDINELLGSLSSPVVFPEVSFPQEKKGNRFPVIRDKERLNQTARINQIRLPRRRYIHQKIFRG